MSLTLRIIWLPVVFLALLATWIAEIPEDFGITELPIQTLVEERPAGGAGQAAPLDLELGPGDLSVWEVFFSVFGLIYAIIVGLLIVEAHRRQRDLSSVVQAELNALGDINDFLRYFNHRDIKNVRPVIESLKLYCDDVQNDTDPRRRSTLISSIAATPEEQDKTLSVRRRQHIKRIIKCVGQLRVMDKNDGYALQAIMDRISALTTFRAQKTEIARLGFPGVYYAILMFMTIAMIIAFIAMPVNSVFLHFFVVGCVAFATTILTTIVYDLDNPLDGIWNIRREVTKSVDMTSENIQVHLQTIDQLAELRREEQAEQQEHASAAGMGPTSPPSHGETPFERRDRRELLFVARERHAGLDQPAD